MQTLSLCPGCHSTAIAVYESVTATALARAWAAYVPEADQMIHAYVSRGEMPDPITMYRCSDCTLEFANPQFAAGSEWYAVVERYLDRWEYSQTLADLPTGIRLLEIGCGQGFFLERARAAGHTVVGLDFNADALQVAGAKGLDVHAWDLRELAQRVDTRFNAIVLYHVIEHIEDLDSFFADLNQIALPTATLHFSCPGPHRFTTDLDLHRPPGKRDMWDYPPHHQTRWNQQSASAMLARLGWRLQKYAEEPFNWQGVAVARVSDRLLQRRQQLAQRPGIERKARIAAEMLALAGARHRYKGMSQYVMAGHH